MFLGDFVNSKGLCGRRGLFFREGGWVGMEFVERVWVERVFGEGGGKDFSLGVGRCLGVILGDKDERILVRFV